MTVEKLKNSIGKNGVSGSSVEGGLWLGVSTDISGNTCITRERHAAPIHVGKPYREGTSLLLQTVSPTAGLLAGDRLTIDISLDKGAGLTLFNPSVTRVHSMKEGGGFAGCSQHFELSGEPTFLEFINEGTLLQKESWFEQDTEIHLNQGASMIYSDIIWPGRIASGEAFSFKRFRSAFDVFRDNRKVVMERSLITPVNRSGVSWQRAIGNSVMATWYVLTKKEVVSAVAIINEMQTDSDCWVGSSTLDDEGLVIRVLAANSVSLRRIRQEIRKQLSATLGRQLCSVRNL